MANQSIGALALPMDDFPGTGALLERFREASFRALPPQERFEIVNRELLGLIQATPSPCFLLVPFLKYLARITEEKILDSRLNQTGFESWLGHDSGLSFEENRLVRGKLVGEYLPREAYQQVFPIGGGKIHPGSHTVTAHNPPDIDTTTASFITWLDAFAARVGSALHIWNLPGGRPGDETAFLFDELFTPHVFTRLAKDRRHIAHVGHDILTRDRFILARGERDLTTYRHNRYQNAIVMVDEGGFYVGDWRLGDIDTVGRVRRTLTGALREYLRLVTAELSLSFGKDSLTRAEVAAAVASLSERPFQWPHDLSVGHLPDDPRELDALLSKIYGLEGGGATPLKQVLRCFDERTGSDFASYFAALDRLLEDDLWDGAGLLKAGVAPVFRAFEAVHGALSRAVRQVGAHTLRMDVVMQVKHEVLGFSPNYVTTRATIDEIRDKIHNYEHITVVFPTRSGKLLPVGTIHAEELEKPIQGTVSLRDFANGHEISLAGHLEVISVIDHHKSEIRTRSAAAISVSDVQSSNTLLAEFSFARHDRYSLRGQSSESLARQRRQALPPGPEGEASLSLARRLIAKEEARRRSGAAHWVHPHRESAEYLCFLNAILDDTDLLAKAGWRDLEVVCELVNRLKSLQAGEEVEILGLEDLPHTPAGVATALRRLLTHPELHSFYARIYAMKERLVEAHLASAAAGDDLRLFSDTKVQNARFNVGQSKLYPGNRPTFERLRAPILNAWLRRMAEVRATQPGVDFFLQMISTVRGAAESFADREPPVSLRDEIWIRFDRTNDQVASQFRLFLARWRNHPRLDGIALSPSVEGGPVAERAFLTHILGDVFGEDQVAASENAALPHAVAVLRFRAGALNSRKTDITPYLPRQGE
ncbi:MAG: hypothetical protein J0L75_10735 [Spirochaetes bacterium]|nr:hypothetical protein [Spirochaetota bacterium]